MHYHWLGQLCAVFFMQCKLVQTFFFSYFTSFFVRSGWFGWVLGDWLGRTVVDRSLVGEAGKVFC